MSSKKHSEAVHQFDPMIYPRLFWIYRGADIDFVRRLFTSRSGGELLHDEELRDVDNPTLCLVTEAMQRKSGSLGYLLYVKTLSHLKAGTVAHEAFHVAASIFSDCNAQSFPDDQEPLAYLIDWCATCIDRVAKGKTILSNTDHSLLMEAEATPPEENE